MSASGGRFVGAPGANPGHTGIVRCPEGGQPDVCPIRPVGKAVKAARSRTALMLILKSSRQQNIAEIIAAAGAIPQIES
jgi:hypothetical protein